MLQQAALESLLGPPLFVADEEIVGHQPLLVGRLAADLLGALLQFNEHGDFRPQDERVDGLEDEVDRPRRIAADKVRGLLVHRRKKNDRDVAGLLAAPDHGSRLVPVHAGHQDVQQY
ncbi:MAG TPA: hypothetical protein VHG92_12030, partial [Afifellaceae bacterium]|nr:hypothetical protein [Afifellaceae bacterium]